MRLHAEREGHGPPIVLVHGFTQTGACWGPLAADLATDHEVVRFDAPGHGRSAEVHADLPSGGRMIADQAGRAVYLGYSMGGRYLLHLALARPEVVTGLVLLGATGGIDDPGERAARAAADRATAARLRTLGLPEFLKTWIAQPLFSGIPADRQFLPERSTNTVDGLEQSLVRAGTGVQEPLWGRLHHLDMPVLVVAGALDTKFSALGAHLVDAIGPNAMLTLVPDAGHAAHLERPAEFTASVRAWLEVHNL